MQGAPAAGGDFAVDRVADERVLEPQTVGRGAEHARGNGGHQRVLHTVAGYLNHSAEDVRAEPLTQNGRRVDHLAVGGVQDRRAVGDQAPELRLPGQDILVLLRRCRSDGFGEQSHQQRISGGALVNGRRELVVATSDQVG